MRVARLTKRLTQWLRSWLRTRPWRRLPKLPRWWPWLLLLLVPILVVNLAVAWVGRSAVFPLSPFYFRYKVEALGAYALHRPRCVFTDDKAFDPAMLARAELKNHLPCGLLGAIIQVESGGKPHRISSAGAMGPMQLIPPTARALGVNDPFDAEESLDGAARYLHAQMVSFHSVPLAAAAYNAGPGAIVGFKVPHNGQTEIYVDRVMHALAVERRARCAPPRKTVVAPATAARGVTTKSLPAPRSRASK